MSDPELATFPTAYLTAENMLNRASVAEGERVLVTGASGGVGSALIQLALRRGAKPIAMCSERKAKEVAELEPLAVLPRSPADLRAELRESTGFDTVHAIADVVGGEDFARLIDLLERGGRCVTAGAIAGPIVQLDLRTLYLRDLTVAGVTVGRMGTFADVVRYIERNEIRPLLAETFPLTHLREAQSMFLKKEPIGNIAVIP